jgi:GNAT superfamily N-acetyltransferase
VGAEAGIRRAEPRDRAAVLSLWVALIDHHRRLDRDYPELPGIGGTLEREVDLALSGRGSRIYLAVAEAEPIGFVSAEIVGERDRPGVLGAIHELYVVPERRGAGLGRALVGAVEEWFSARAVARRRVRVEISNPAALRFWRAVGYADDPSVDVASEPRARILLRRA